MFFFFSLSFLLLWFSCLCRFPWCFACPDRCLVALHQWRQGKLLELVLTAYMFLHIFSNGIRYNFPLSLQHDSAPHLCVCTLYGLITARLKGSEAKSVEVLNVRMCIRLSLCQRSALLNQVPLAWTTQRGYPELELRTVRYSLILLFIFCALSWPLWTVMYNNKTHLSNC